MTAVVLVAALIGSLAGCQVGPQSEPTATPPVPVERPTAAGELVVRIETRGGLLPPLERERQLPSLSIYGDGQVLVPTPVDADFPGPAGYPLEQFWIDAGLIDDIVAAGLSIGLSGEDRHLPQEGPEFVADAGATTVTLVTGGTRHVTRADALFDGGDSDTAARIQLRDLVSRLVALRPTDGAPALYEPEAYRVFAAAPDPGFGDAFPDAAPVAWPFPEPLAGWGEPFPPDGLSVDVRCRVMTLAQLGDALEVLHGASSTTIVLDAAGEEAIVAWRPLLPDEAGCAPDA